MSNFNPTIPFVAKLKSLSSYDNPLHTKGQISLHQMLPEQVKNLTIEVDYVPASDGRYASCVNAEGDILIYHLCSSIQEAYTLCEQFILDHYTIERQ